MEMYTEEINSEEEDANREAESIQYLKDNFTYEDFWDYLPTQNILKNEFIQTFNDGVGKQIADLYAQERMHSIRQFSNLFAFDVDGTRGGFLESIVFNNIEKEYDIDIFYKNPQWATSFVSYHLEHGKKEKKKVFVIPKKSLRKFNWANKSYEKQVKS